MVTNNDTLNICLKTGCTLSQSHALHVTNPGLSNALYQVKHWNTLFHYEVLGCGYIHIFILFIFIHASIFFSLNLFSSNPLCFVNGETNLEDGMGCRGINTWDILFAEPKQAKLVRGGLIVLLLKTHSPGAGIFMSLYVNRCYDNLDAYFESVLYFYCYEWFVGSY